MAEKPTIQKVAPELWEESFGSSTMSMFLSDVAETEKLLLFGETGSGKTKFYLGILEYLKRKGIPVENMKMEIVYPDRPTGLTKLAGLIPREFIESDCIDVYQVNNYEETVKATATAERVLEEHYKKTGSLGWLVVELLENMWTFSQDFYSRQAYGKNMGEYFAQMQTILSKDKAEKKTAYEAFSGPYGGPWPIIKFFHNFNWIDRIKRFPFNTVFTSEIKEEDNKDSVFHALGYRPAGEKHNQHRMDTILYLSHKKDNFTMKPYKMTGYTAFYGETNITNKNGYAVHKELQEKLASMGRCVSKIQDLEQQAGIKPPAKPSKPAKSEVKKEPEKPKEKDVEPIKKDEEKVEEEEEKIEEKIEKKIEEKKKEKEDEGEMSLDI